MKLLTALAFVQIVVLFPLKAQDVGLTALIQKGATLEKLSGDFEFTEGPVADKTGNVYFTDQPNNRIMIWDTRSGLKLFMQPCGRSNGLTFDRNGNLWACADEKNELWEISPEKKITVVCGTYDGKPFNGPNDVWILPSGGIYITDPFFKRTWWDHSDMPQAKQRVYYISPDHNKITIAADDLLQPNGIVGSADGKTLYIADMRGNKTWSYTVQADGTLTGKKLFCEMGSDGITLDSGGNLYLTGRGVTVFDSNGKKLGNIPVPESWTANVCFGDEDFKSLFITASKGLYRIKLNVEGIKPR